MYARSIPMQYTYNNYVCRFYEQVVPKIKQKI